MTKTVKGARFLLKRSTSSGVKPTLPTTTDHTIGWTDTDIYVGEMFANVADSCVWIRTNNSAKAIQFAMLDPTTNRLASTSLPLRPTVDSITVNCGITNGFNFSQTTSAYPNKIYQTVEGELYVGNTQHHMMVTSSGINISSSGVIKIGASSVNVGYISMADGNVVFPNNIKINSIGYIRFNGGQSLNATTFEPGVAIHDVNNGFYSGTANTIFVVFNKSLKHRFDSSGNFYAAGTILGSQAITSDKNLKRNINNIENGLSVIDELNSVSFTYKYDNTDKKHNGFIAQDVEKILPELVDEYELPFVDGESNKMYKTINYVEIIPYAVAAIKEEHKMIQQHDEEIALLKERIEILEASIKKSKK